MKQQQQQPPPPQPPQQSSPPFASPGVPAFLSKLWALLGETPSNQLITWSQVGRPPPPHPLPGRVWRSPRHRPALGSGSTGAGCGPRASAGAWRGRKTGHGRMAGPGRAGLGRGRLSSLALSLCPESAVERELRCSPCGRVPRRPRVSGVGKGPGAGGSAVPFGSRGAAPQEGRAAGSEPLLFPVCQGPWGAATWGEWPGASRARCAHAGLAGRAWPAGEVKLGTSLLIVQPRASKLLQWALLTVVLKAKRVF